LDSKVDEKENPTIEGYLREKNASGKVES
jgi:hypothetical protein